MTHICYDLTTKSHHYFRLVKTYSIPLGARSYHRGNHHFGSKRRPKPAGSTRRRTNIMQRVSQGGKGRVKAGNWVGGTLVHRGRTKLRNGTQNPTVLRPGQDKEDKRVAVCSVQAPRCIECEFGSQQGMVDGKRYEHSPFSLKLKLPGFCVVAIDTHSNRTTKRTMIIGFWEFILTAGQLWSFDSRTRFFELF